MVKTRGGGSFHGRKPHDVPEQQRSPEPRSSKRRREDGPGGANILRRSPRLSKTMVIGGDTGSKTQKEKRRRSGAKSKKRLPLDCTEKEMAKKSKKKRVGDELSVEKEMEEAVADNEGEENIDG